MPKGRESEGAGYAYTVKLRSLLGSLADIGAAFCERFKVMHVLPGLFPEAAPHHRCHNSHEEGAEGVFVLIPTASSVAHLQDDSRFSDSCERPRDIEELLAVGPSEGMSSWCYTD